MEEEEDDGKGEEKEQEVEEGENEKEGQGGDRGLRQQYLKGQHVSVGKENVLHFVSLGRRQYLESFEGVI